MTKDTTALKEQLLKELENTPGVMVLLPTPGTSGRRKTLVRISLNKLTKLIAHHTAEVSRDITPDEMLLAENRRLREAGDKLYEAASYTGRTFDGTHRLLSAAAYWLDTRGKNSGLYQKQRQESSDER